MLGHRVRLGALGDLGLLAPLLAPARLAGLGHCDRDGLLAIFDSAALAAFFSYPPTPLTVPPEELTMAKQIQDAYIVAAVRTPVGKAPRGMFRHVRPDFLFGVFAGRGLEKALLFGQGAGDVAQGLSQPNGAPS